MEAKLWLETFQKRSKTVTFFLNKTAKQPAVAELTIPLVSTKKESREK
jgi:hypothetical protein